MPHTTNDFLNLQAALAGEYSLQREIGRGGMGIVYLARDVQLDRDVAIKVLPTHLAATAESRDRFIREARTAAALSHPHIVPIHRVGEADGFVFFVMTYVDGETLGERLRTHGPLPPHEASRIMREVAWALAYAHGRGIVHRDIKPDNILLEAGTGRALVTDFGIAHGASSTPSSEPGKIMGTAHFMSPEQAAGEPVDGRGDLYALGVVGYLAVSGRLPFEGASLPALLMKQVNEPAPSILHTSPGLPRALGLTIDRSLARNPDERFADGESMAAALAPESSSRPALPPTLRAWLAARNPLLVPYLGWAGMFGTLTSVNLVAWITGNRPDGFADIPLLAAITALPIFPVVGFHLYQAYRQFQAGHSLADLRSALEVSQRERAETDAVSRKVQEPVGHRLLRLATIASASWFGVTFVLMARGTIHEDRIGFLVFLAPVLTTMLLGAVSNALDVRFIPDRIRAWWQSGLRDRLWRGKLGNWLARRLGAPERSRSVDDGAFRATEAALGVAAGELFAALPGAYREELHELPDTVAALEARAAAARAEIELVAALEASAPDDASLLESRRQVASSQLAESVAALEGIRLDLLRLHAGSSDLAPLTTLLDAARLVGEDVNRLAAAQREMEADLVQHRTSLGRLPTPE